MTQTRGSRRTAGFLTAGALALLTAGCQATGQAGTPAAAATGASSSPAAATGTSPIDGAYEAHVDWATTPPADCPVTGPGETTTDYRMTLDGGRMTITVRTNLDPDPVLGSESRYRVFRDRIEIDDEQPATARVTLAGDTLTFSDMQGGGCDGRTVMTTVPWHRVQG